MMHSYLDCPGYLSRVSYDVGTSVPKDSTRYCVFWDEYPIASCVQDGYPGRSEIALFQRFANSGRMPPEIKNPADDSHIVFNCIVNCVRESFRQEPVIAKNLLMNACVKLKGVNIREQRIEKILTQSLALFFIEKAAAVQIVHS